MNIYFLLLSAFKYTGGLEKFNRAFMKALDEISLEQNFELLVKSSHDELPHERYIPKKKFEGFGGSKIKFAMHCLVEAHRIDIAFIGHINLAPVAVLLKLLNPKIKLILIGHGIEIWDKQILIKKILLKWAYKILAVSNFTKNQIVSKNKVDRDKIIIFPNTLDPYFVKPNVNEKPNYLLKRYNIESNTKIILTVSRLTKYEGYKGFDKVIDALPKVIKKVPDIKYLLCGKYDDAEGKRLIEKVKSLDLEKYFILTGFIKEEELTDHYLLADVFILPSKKEGFGIVFIEAAACGIPVIAGNLDGSVDALMNGELGKLINPDNVEEISEAIISQLNQEKFNKQKKVIENFGFSVFKEKLSELINIL
ncbi:glycosyltransferase family 4 protein [Ignavibacterium sp.]|uniref:glycosyltransferase family 4 protein n=1 Tax=Ignavibacterium sp. TaxID=2651167 RepID=UPI00307D3740